MGNIFFDLDQLGYLGQNVIIGKTVRIRYPHLVNIGDNCIIDDFTYISTSLHLEANVHISASCSIIGGAASYVNIGEFSTFAPNVTVAAGSDDYKSGIATPLVPKQFKADLEIGIINIGKHCILGSGSVVLPNVTFGNFSALGALSLAKENLDEGGLYAGIPAKRIGDRNMDEIQRLENEWKNKSG